MSATDWVEVAELAELEEDEIKAVRVGEAEIGLLRIGAEVFAFDNICSHAYAALSDGFVEGDVVECPLHQAQFNVRTGKALCAPASEDIRTYPVRIDGERVSVQVSKA